MIDINWCLIYFKTSILYHHNVVVTYNSKINIEQRAIKMITNDENNNRHQQ